MTDETGAASRRPLRVSRRRLSALLVAIPLGAAAVATATSPDQRLIVESVESGRQVFAIPVNEGDTVTLAYTHSVEKTPVRDIYVVEDGALRMARMEFSSFGAGLPTEGVERTESGYAVTPNTRHERLTVAPSEVAGHELIVADRRYDLVEAVTGSVAINVKAASLPTRALSSRPTGSSHT